MGDVGKEGKPDAAAAPPARHSAGSRSEQVESRETRLEQARRFLQDAQVQSATRERKAEFLKSKGLSEGDIEELLKEVASDVRTPPRGSVGHLPSSCCCRHDEAHAVSNARPGKRQ